MRHKTTQRTAEKARQKTKKGRARRRFSKDKRWEGAKATESLAMRCSSERSRHELYDALILDCCDGKSVLRSGKREKGCVVEYEGVVTRFAVTEGVWVFWGGDEMGRMHEGGESASDGWPLVGDGAGGGGGGRGARQRGEGDGCPAPGTLGEPTTMACRKETEAREPRETAKMAA